MIFLWTEFELQPATSVVRSPPCVTVRKPRGPDISEIAAFKKEAN